MTKKQSIRLFEEKKVRTVWDDEKGNETVTNCDQLKLRAYDIAKHLDVGVRALLVSSKL